MGWLKSTLAGLRAGVFCVGLRPGMCLGLVSIGGALAVAQNADQDAIAKANEQKGRAALAAMVQALGGERWLTLKDATVSGRVSGFYQGKPTGEINDYFDFRRYPDEERLEVGKKRDVVEFFLKNEGWEVTYRGKKALPKDIVDERLRRLGHSVETAIRVWLKDPQTIVIFDKQSLVERHLADQVTLISPSNDSITIEMDAQTHLPLRRTYQWRDPVYKDKNTEAEEYDDYHTVDGIATPYTTTRFHNGDMTSQRYLYKDRIAYNTDLPDSLFDVDATAAKIKK